MWLGVGVGRRGRASGSGVGLGAGGCCSPGGSGGRWGAWGFLVAGLCVLVVSDSICSFLLHGALRVFFLIPYVDFNCCFPEFSTVTVL